MKTHTYTRGGAEYKSVYLSRSTKLLLHQLLLICYDIHNANASKVKVCKLVKKTDLSLIIGNILKKVLILYSECTHEYSLFLNVLKYNEYKYITSTRKKCTRVHKYASTMAPNPDLHQAHTVPILLLSLMIKNRLKNLLDREGDPDYHFNIIICSL